MEEEEEKEEENEMGLRSKRTRLLLSKFRKEARKTRFTMKGRYILFRILVVWRLLLSLLLFSLRGWLFCTVKDGGQ